ncbi:hypothetical protein Syun_014153 [Stephania yunnanensis]|uniref:alpha-1,2-Mannosidase n=1 Tax=Stephania yunnanensis TaxID=152371 RepID=A0AAP0JKG8_9MAGN
MGGAIMHDVLEWWKTAMWDAVVEGQAVATTRPSGLPSPSAGDWSLQSPKPSPLFAAAQSKDDVNSFGGLGATLIDSLDTLFIMGLDEQFQKAKEWVATSLDFNKNYDASVFETTIRLHCKAKLQRRPQELTQTTPDQPVDDEAVYYKVAGECPKGCVYSLRSLGRKKRRYVDLDVSTSQEWKTAMCYAVVEGQAVVTLINSWRSAMYSRLIGRELQNDVLVA